MNKCNIVLFSWWSIIAVVVVMALVACNAEAATEFNSTNWNLTSGTMLEHGDGNLRAPPSVWNGIAGYWSPGTDVGSGTILKDLSGNGNDGTIHGATWNVSGGGLDYNGTSDYVDCGNDESLNITDELTLIADIYIKNTSSEYQLIIGKGGSGPDTRVFLLYLSENNVKTLTQPGVGTVDTLISDENISIELWAHTGMFWDASNINVYVNGIEKSKSVNTTKLESNTEHVYIGMATSNNLHFNGTIGKSYIYNIGLTNDQINETRDNYHNITSYMETDSPIDAGTGYVNMYVWFNGTDAGSNTTIELQVKQNDTATWETAIADVTMNTNLTIPGGMLYQNASFRWYANTTYQPETDVLESVVFESGNAPPTPTNLQNTTGNFWVNYTWDAGSGLVTDSYNVSYNGTWDNTSYNTYRNESVGAHGYLDIIVYAYNNTNNVLSDGFITDNVTVPNNAPVLSDVSSSYEAYENSTFTLDANHTDADSDTITYSDNASEWNINSATGEVSWELDWQDVGVHSYRITIDDGKGGTDYQDFTVTINGAQNTALTSVDTSFENGNPGTDFTDNVITLSFYLINSGSIDADISAKFTTNYESTYGLVSGTSTIGGSNFKLGNVTLDTLLDNGNSIDLTDVVPGEVTQRNYEVQLRVPAGQDALSYSGTIELTFSDAT